MTTAGPVDRLLGERGVGEVGERVSAEEDEDVDLARRRSGEDAGGVESFGAWPQAELQGADDVAPSQRREHRHLRLNCGNDVVHGTQRGGRRIGRLGKVGSAGDDDHGAAAQLVDDEWIGECRRGGRCPARLDGNRTPSERGEAGRHWRQLDDPRALADHAVAKAEVQDRQFFLEVGTEEDHRRRIGRALDRRPGEVEEFGRQPVTQLGVTMIDADGVGEASPGEGVLVRASRPTEQGDALRPSGIDRRPQGLGHRGEGDGPRRLRLGALTRGRAVS